MSQPKKTRQAAEPIAYGILPELLGYHLRLAQLQTFQDFAATLGRLDLTPTVFGVLVLIDANPGMKQAALARAIRLDRSSVVPLIDRLEGRGLVRREPAPDDRRSNALYLTAAGRDLLATATPLVREHERRLCRRLSEPERASLIALLEKLTTP